MAKFNDARERTTTLPARLLLAYSVYMVFLSQRMDGLRKGTRNITLANHLYVGILNGRAELLTFRRVQKARRALLQNGHNG
jgi:hypothetical protein